MWVRNSRASGTIRRVTRTPVTAGSCNRIVAMIDPDEREARIQAELERLRPASDDTLRKMAEAIVDRPDSELFRSLEIDLRDAALDLATAAQQVVADGRKKGATLVPAPSAPTADTTPASTPTGRVAS